VAHQFINTAVYVLLLLGCSPAEQTESATPSHTTRQSPNVLLVSLDTLRADHLPSAGYSRDTAPTLSRIAAEGARFSRSWSQSSNTDATHSSIFSGRFVSHHGKYGSRQRLPDSTHTLAEHFAAHGYRTFGVASSDKFIAKSGFSQGFDTWQVYKDGMKNDWSTQATATALERLGEPDTDRPWFGFVHLFDAHAPYNSPEPHKTRFLRGPLDIEPRRTVDYIREHRRARDRPEAELHDLVDLYDGGISYLDTRVAQLWEQAQRSERPTIMVLTSDHGEAFGEHDYLGHSDVVWEEAVRVPLIVWAPDRVPADRTLDLPVQSADLYGTLSELAGLPVPDGLDGASLAAELQGHEARAPRDRVLPVQTPKHWALIQEVDGTLFKYRVALKAQRSFLVDIEEDPTERVDLSAQHPELVAELQAVMVELAIHNPGRFSDERHDMDAAEVEALKAIGYLDE